MARILVVDDTRFMRDMIKQIVWKTPHRVIAEAEDGVEAVEQFAIWRPDIVMLDIMMPRMNGIVALRHIFAMEPKANVIVCSVLSPKELVMEAINMGVKDFIAKPIQECRVIEALEKLACQVG